MLLALSLTASPMPAPAAEDAGDGTSFTLVLDGADIDVTSAAAVVYPNPGGSPRVIPSEAFGFRNASLLIFGSDNRLIEAGGQLLSNTDGRNGSPQLSVTIPAGGFLIAFGPQADARLKACYDTAFEGAMLYNATMSIVYEVRGVYDADAGTLSISYPAPAPETDETLKFLFIGNSATYFNGTPLKFKGLCRAAGVDVSVSYCTFGSANLLQFADGTHDYGKALRSALAQKKYDYVVLQDAGGATADATDEALSALIPLVEENGARPLLYMRYSDKTDDSARIADTTRHVRTYTSMAEKYGVPAAPAAVAFREAIQAGYGKALYADDLSHHSKAGSYLIACTWLYAYLGISPVGNAYTAELDGETVRFLQQTALESCAEADDEAAHYVDDSGVEWSNIARGKSYTSTGGAYDGDWTDTKADGTPLGKLTDGYACSDGADTLVGCYKGNEVEITVDLGGAFTVKRVTTDLFGNAGWGIPSPDDASVTFLISEDGAHFLPFGAGIAERETGPDGWQRAVFACTAEEAVRASYVKVVYRLAGNFCWVSEINAFGAEATAQPPENSAAESDVPDAASKAQEASAPVGSPEASEASTQTSAELVIGIVCAAAAVVLGLLFFLLQKRSKHA